MGEVAVVGEKGKEELRSGQDKGFLKPFKLERGGIFLLMNLPSSKAAEKDESKRRTKKKSRNHFIERCVRRKLGLLAISDKVCLFLYTHSSESDTILTSHRVTRLSFNLSDAVNQVGLFLG